MVKTYTFTDKASPDGDEEVTILLTSGKQEDVEKIQREFADYAALESRCRELEEVVRELSVWSDYVYKKHYSVIGDDIALVLAKAKRLLSKEGDNGKD